MNRDRRPRTPRGTLSCQTQLGPHGSHHPDAAAVSLMLLLVSVGKCGPSFSSYLLAGRSAFFREN